MRMRMVMILALLVLWTLALSAFAPVEANSPTVTAAGTIAYVRGAEDIGLFSQMEATTIVSGQSRGRTLTT